MCKREAELAAEDLRDVRETFHLEEEVGTLLGRSVHLQQTLQRRTEETEP